MKIKDILKKIDDSSLYVEIREKSSDITIINCKKNDPLIVYNNTLKNNKIKALNVQYLNNKRTLIIYI